MDSSSKRMYDIFKNQICKDLGPLDPNWFDSLTAEALAGHLSDQDELCANQEALFKTPNEKKGPCSQMCSTPKIFKHQSSLFQTENESFSTEPEMLSWTKASPCVLQIEPSQSANLLFHSPQSTDANEHRSQCQNNTDFAQHISERLGATVGDMTWTSSLNTPPPEPSTLILSRKETSSTVTLSKGTYGLVRNLFSSNSSMSTDEHLPESPEHTASLDKGLSGSLSAAVRDKPFPSTSMEVTAHKEEHTQRATISTKSSSILRKVRNERVNRRLINPSSESNHGTQKVSPRKTDVFGEVRSCESLSDTNVLSQWSPLNLSDVMPNSEVSTESQSSGLLEIKHEKDNTAPNCGLIAESKQFTSSEQCQGNNLIDTLQGSQVPLITRLPKDFSPAACLSALKRAKQKAKQESGSQHSEIIPGQDSSFVFKQSSVHDSGFSSVTETAHLSSTNKSPLKMYSTAQVIEFGNKDCEASNPTVKENDNVSVKGNFNTLSYKNVNRTSLNINQETKKDQHTGSDASTGDFHLTVSQKAEVNELCAILEQHSESQFEFTQPPVENVNGEYQNKQYLSLKSETKMRTAKSAGLVTDIDTYQTFTAPRGFIQRQNVLLTPESASNKPRRHFKVGDQTGNPLEDEHFHTCQGFKTAKGEEIGVSAKSIQKSKNFFNDCEENEALFKNTLDVEQSLSENNIVKNRFSDRDTATFKKPCLNGFDSVKVNDNNKELGGNESVVPTPRQGVKRSHETHPISNKSVKRTKSLTAEYEGGEKLHFSKLNLLSLAPTENGDTGIKNETSSTGFTTAGGKCLQYSKVSIEKIKHLWKDFDDFTKLSNGATTFESITERSVSNVEHQSEDPLLKAKPLPPEHTGFLTSPQTSRPNITVVSSPALTKANEILTEHENSECKAYIKLPDPSFELKDSAFSNKGFVLASGKELEVSAEALLKGKAMFDDISPASVNRETSQIPKMAMLAEQTESFKPQISETIKASSKNALDCSNVSLSDCSTGRDDRILNPDQDSFAFSIGFATASGKEVVVSEEALNVAQKVLSEAAETRHGLQNILPRNTTSCNEPQLKSVGATLTSEKPFNTVNNMQKMNNQIGNKRKSLLCAQRHKTSHSSHIENNSTIKANVLIKKDSLNLPFECSATFLDTVENTSTAGFTTASGKKVAVSEGALNKAKSFLNGNIDLESDANITKKIRNGPSLIFPDSVSHVNKSPSNISSTINCGDGGIAASGKTVTVSEEALSKVMLCPTEEVNSKKVLADAQASNIPCMKSGAAGFTTASGRNVSVSEEALNKAISLLTDKGEQGCKATTATTKKKDSLSLLPRHAGTNLDWPPSDNSCVKTSTNGFTTANGKTVTVSEEALNKAISLLSENVEQTNDKHIFKNEKDLRLPLGHMLQTSISSNPILKNSFSGLTAVSGKKFTVSEEAQMKEMNVVNKNLVQDGATNIPVEMENKNGSSKPLGHAVNNYNTSSGNSFGKSGFATASGKKLSVSEDAMNKAIHLLTEKVEQGSNATTPVTKRNKESSSLPLGHTAPIMKSMPASTLCCVKTTKTGFATASGKKVTVSDEALNKAMDLLTEKVDVVSDKTLTSGPMSKDCSGTMFKCGYVQPDFSNGKHQSLSSFTPDLNQFVKTDITKVPSVSESNTDAMQFSEYNLHKSPYKRSPPHCSMVNLDAPNLSNCTTTQQRFLAQEALDCTRALLEDEVRAAQSLMTSFEEVPKPVSEASQIHRRKRPRENEIDLPEGKSSEENDRALDRRKDSILNPVKSCVSGLCKDRRVFQYQVLLHPNLTKSPRFGKDDVKMQKLTSAMSSTPTRSGQPDLKAPLFVPPFLNTRAKTPKCDNGPQKNNKKPCPFVPPFKKLKPEEGAAKTKDKDGDSVKESPKTGTFIPPTKKNTHTNSRSKSDEDLTNQQCPPPDAAKDAPEVYDQKATEEKENVKDSREAEEALQREILLNVESVDLARDLQDMRIRKKSRQTIRPIPGSLFLTKSSQKRHTFRTVVDGQTPQKHSPTQLYIYGVDQPVCQITSKTAEEFRFDLLKFCKRENFSEAGGVQLADGGWLVPRRDGTVGKEEFYRALCDTPGVDPKLLSQSWVSNHYRWVVWKLASMERVFPTSMASFCFTPEQVLLQLKYRYDIEVDHSRRPCLRKIMERDDTSAKTLVLCVCGTVSSGQPTPETPQDAKIKPEPCGAVVWLTDGWYSIKAQLDEPLTSLLHRGAISEGVKLITHGAQLMGAQEACAPLEAPETLLLKVYANSTRRVRWDTKLGFYKDPRPFVLPLSSVFSAGGVVSCVDMVILRVYPLQWMERTADRGVVFRSERAEEKEARRYNNHKQKMMEAIYTKIKAEFEKEEKEKLKSQRRRRTVRREDLSRCHDGEELFEAVGEEADVEAFLTPEQLQSLSAYRRTLLDQKNAALQERLRRAVEEAETGEGSCPRRDTATVWRLSIRDYREPPGSSVYQLSVWKPSSDLQAVLKEGGRYEVSNLTASEGRTQSGRATVQLTSSRKTHFRNLQASPEKLQTLFQPRVSVTFAQLQKPGFWPLCGEVDLAGCVISITEQQGSSPVFYLADEHLDLVKVHSLLSFVRCGWDDVLKPRGLVCLSNLQLRVGCSSPTPVLYAGDMSALSTHPRENHLRQALGRLQQALKDQEDFFLRAEQKLSEILSSNGTHFSAVNPRTPQSTKTGHDPRTSVTPSAQTLVAPNSLPKRDPRSLKRRRALDYLCQFPPPPPLSPLSSTASPGVHKTFLPPRRSLAPALAPGAAAPPLKRSSAPGTEEEGWVHDDELAMIDTQELRAVDALSDLH